mmetsp:Transcript_19858/g.28921  ORF Transcript_19858/g.28921 Transcript_19858/m.28921 type:complete len:238 (+) Transcript_19858:609-1322(+)
MVRARSHQKRPCRLQQRKVVALFRLRESTLGERVVHGAGHILERPEPVHSRIGSWIADVSGGAGTVRMSRVLHSRREERVEECKVSPFSHRRLRAGESLLRLRGKCQLRAASLVPRELQVPRRLSHPWRRLSRRVETVKRELGGIRVRGPATGPATESARGVGQRSHWCCRAPCGLHGRLCSSAFEALAQMKRRTRASPDKRIELEFRKASFVLTASTLPSERRVQLKSSPESVKHV